MPFSRALFWSEKNCRPWIQFALTALILGVALFVWGAFEFGQDNPDADLLFFWSAACIAAGFLGAEVAVTIGHIENLYRRLSNQSDQYPDSGSGNE